FKQKTLNDKYFIYSYCRNSDFAFTDDICGTRIIKSEEPFTEKQRKKNRWNNSEMDKQRYS
ncbi:hypothetical protein, partial [Lacinutrix jangbogonensis]|uniref:hypothetical protein n=1 Tax=Lacinutrix jangbogonensis TaxID=1469557 RepID=UPI00053D5BCC